MTIYINSGEVRKTLLLLKERYPNGLFHGSPLLFDNQVHPTRVSSLTGSLTVFATPIFGVAMLFCSKWTDKEFDLSYRSRHKKYVFTEKKEGIFDKCFEGRQGYIYVVDDASFSTHPNVANFELVSFSSVNIIETIVVRNLAETLECQKSVLVHRLDDN